jgi:hypothetical protein
LARPKAFFQRPVGSLPMMKRFWCASRFSTYWPSFFKAASTFSFEPVKKYQPGRALKRAAYSLSLAGVSLTGSTEKESSSTSLPKRSPT